MKKTSILADLLPTSFRILIIGFAFAGCEGYNSRTGGGEEDVPCFPSVITMPPTTTVACGNELRLDAGLVASAVSYEWNGPNYFHSTSKIPVLQANQFSEGEYTVDINTGYGCESVSATTFLTVTPPVPPCSPTNNKLTLDGFADINITSCTFSINSDNKYQISCNGSGGYAIFTFTSNVKPIPGIYQIASSNFYNDDVKMELYQGNKNWYARTSGSQSIIYVTSLGGKLQVSYCTTSFQANGSSVQPNGSGMITEP